MSALRCSLTRAAAPALAAMALAATLVTTAASPAGATPTAAPPPTAAAAALDWLEGELEVDGGHLTTSYASGSDVVSYDDWGLTLDAVLALAAGGRGAGASATTALDQVADHIADYVTGASFGAPDDRYAAALGKAVFSAAALGADPTSFGGLDLVTELRNRMQTTGADAGRFSDRSDWGDYSNGIGQALAVMGLARTSAGAPAPAVEFLLDQQCPGGGFRGDYTASGGCAADDESSVDATAFALQALTAVDPTCAVRGAAADAVAWLVDSQTASGAFGAESGANTNSTGLAAQALRALGSTTAADAAAGFVTGMQLTSGDDSGAIALNQAGYDSAADGVAALERDGFRRATAQAVLGLGLAAYSELGADTIDPAAYEPCPAPPAPPAPPAAPTLTASTGTVAPGGSVTVTGTGFMPGESVAITLHSTPIVLGSAVADAGGRVVATVTIPADIEVGDHRIELTGQSSGVTVSVPVEVLASSVADTTTLPATGRHTGAEALGGLALVAVGALLVRASRRRAALA